MSDDLCYLSAERALAKFRDRSLSPVELARAVIARAEASEGPNGAFTQSYFDEAMDAARHAEAAYAKGEARPLEGLLVAVKEDKGVAGKPTSAGSVLFKDNIADGDALPVGRIRAAGGILHARTNICEMGTAGITGSRLHPPTANPWNRDYNSGGSSGGAAAALALGSATLANGSDYCGSIRIPAASCGVVGYKPPRGRNAVSPYFNIDWYDHDGPMARSVADCAILQNAMSGQHPDDLFSLPDADPLPTRFQGARGLRIAVSMDLGYKSVAPEVVVQTREAVAALKEAGSEVEEVDLNWPAGTSQAFRDHSAAVFGGWVEEHLAERDRMTDYAVAFGERARTVTAQSFMRSVATEADMWAALGPILQRFDALICPTLALPAVPLDHDPAGPDMDIAGASVAADFGWMLTYPFNMLSPLPVLAVPSGVAANNLPTGIQIVARPYDDAGAFRVGAVLEEARPWAHRRPSLLSGARQ